MDRIQAFGILQKKNYNGEVGGGENVKHNGVVTSRSKDMVSTRAHTNIMSVDNDDGGLLKDSLP